MTRRGFKGSTTKREAGAKPAPDLVNRDFSVDGPDRVWVADITYAPTSGWSITRAVRSTRRPRSESSAAALGSGSSWARSEMRWTSTMRERLRDPRDGADQPGGASRRRLRCDVRSMDDSGDGSRQLVPDSRFFGETETDVVDWQGPQIVQSLLDLDDSLPLFASPEPRLLGGRGTDSSPRASAGIRRGSCRGETSPAPGAGVTTAVSGHWSCLSQPLPAAASLDQSCPDPVACRSVARRGTEEHRWKRWLRCPGSPLRQMGGSARRGRSPESSGGTQAVVGHESEA